MRASVVLIALAALADPAFASAQACSDPHYRWAEKTDLSHLVHVGRRAAISTILARWSVPPFTGEARFHCAARESTHEATVYSVTGYVRRVRKDEDDGDWHIEVTSAAADPVGRCIIAEIPDPQYGAQFAAVRVRLDSLLAASKVKASGDVDPPVRLRWIGLAFFDGEHRGGAASRDGTDNAHGRCNGSARALWELHPLYWVTRP